MTPGFFAATFIGKLGQGCLLSLPRFGTVTQVMRIYCCACAHMRSLPALSVLALALAGGCDTTDRRDATPSKTEATPDRPKEQPDAACKDGYEGCKCLPGDVCGEGLVCVAGTCDPAPPAPQCLEKVALAETTEGLLTKIDDASRNLSETDHQIRAVDYSWDPEWTTRSTPGEKLYDCIGGLDGSNITKAFGGAPLPRGHKEIKFCLSQGNRIEMRRRGRGKHEYGVDGSKEPKEPALNAAIRSIGLSDDELRRRQHCRVKSAENDGDQLILWCESGGPPFGVEFESASSAAKQVLASAKAGDLIGWEGHSQIRKDAEGRWKFQAFAAPELDLAESSKCDGEPLATGADLAESTSPSDEVVGAVSKRGRRGDTDRRKKDKKEISREDAERCVRSRCGDCASNEGLAEFGFDRDACLRAFKSCVDRCGCKRSFSNNQLCGD